VQELIELFWWLELNLMLKKELIGKWGPNS